MLLNSNDCARYHRASLRTDTTVAENLLKNESEVMLIDSARAQSNPNDSGVEDNGFQCRTGTVLDTASTNLVEMAPNATL